MKKQPTKHSLLILLPAILFCLAVVLSTGNTVSAAEKDVSATSDLSKMNWDEEESSEESQSKENGALSTVNWDEEEDTEDEPEAGKEGSNLTAVGWEDEDTGDDNESTEGLQTLKQEDIDKLESRERLIHISGFLLFIGYIIGGILTAFITRNRKIALAYPPELLILLHTVWPLELFLLPFFGKTNR